MILVDVGNSSVFAVGLYAASVGPSSIFEVTDRLQDDLVLPQIATDPRTDPVLLKWLILEAIKVQGEDVSCYGMALKPNLRSGNGDQPSMTRG